MAIKQMGKYYKWGLFVLVGGVYLYLKSFGIHPTAGGDENTYFYMARLLSEGKLLYRDFFYAHPPLQLLLLGLIYRVFGFSFLLLKASAFIPLLAGAGILYSYLWSKKGQLASLAFLGIFLFGYESLKISTHPFGLNLTAFFLILSFNAFLRDRPGSCGVWSGLAGLTGFYAAPWILVPLGFFLLHRRLDSLGKFLLAGGGVFFGGNLLLVVLFGESYLAPAFYYHFLKPPGRDLVGDVYIQVIRRNPLPFFLPFLYAFSARDAKVAAAIWAGAIYCVFLAVLNPLFTQYFMLPLPFLSFAAGISLSGWQGHFPRPLTKIIALIFALAIVISVAARSSVSALEHEKISGFPALEEFTKFIRDNSREDELLFGHVTVTPLLALYADRQIALDMVDTNHMRFNSGLADMEKTIGQLEAEEKLKYVIIEETRLWMMPVVQNFLKKGRLARVFRVPRRRILVYDMEVEP